MNNHLKQQILSNLQQVPTDTLWGLGINLFVEHVHLKTDADYVKVVTDLKSQLQDGPNNMKTVLGPSYDFFKNLPAAELSL